MPKLTLIVLVPYSGLQLDTGLVLTKIYESHALKKKKTV
ncbi:hypothetical protein FQN60_009477 [Etheostoma spectabile]|uniref:Uncharacterized protein n=1 Tax=Etheostoma spectabile TaxID=54343 RepID=A0A5J5DJ65_9PERO|nr:hypothetical protein FQN60_009477 [Etheostoma spectabile]